MSMDGFRKACLGCKQLDISSSEALLGKPRKHTQVHPWSRFETSQWKGSQSRRLISRCQGRVLEQVAISFSRRPSWPGDGTWVSCFAGRLLTV